MSDQFEHLKAALADRYVIERELGEGGMAKVYLASDLKHDRSVAVKVLRPELAAVLGAERFLQEIKLTVNLQHPQPRLECRKPVSHQRVFKDLEITVHRGASNSGIAGEADLFAPSSLFCVSFARLLREGMEGDLWRDRAHRLRQNEDASLPNRRNAS